MKKLYIFGGFCPLTSTSCIVYDIKTNKWEERAKILENRKLSACAVFEGKIVVSGGFYKQESKSVEVYDHCANSWTKMSDMLERRHKHSSVSINNKLYMIGGGSEFCEVFDSLVSKFHLYQTNIANLQTLGWSNIMRYNQKQISGP